MRRHVIMSLNLIYDWFSFVLLGFADNLIISTMKPLFDTVKHCILVSCIMIKQQSKLVSESKRGLRVQNHFIAIFFLKKHF